MLMVQRRLLSLSANMKSNEFLSEQNTGSLSPSVADAMPSTWVLPELTNQDPYLQYRFGLALASARAAAAGEIPFQDASAFGENMVVVARSAEEEEQLKMALKLYGTRNSSKLISTRPSQETSDTMTTSPVVQNSGKSRRKG